MSKYEELCRIRPSNLRDAIDMCEYGFYGQMPSGLRAPSMVFYTRLVETYLLLSGPQGTTVQMGARLGMFDESHFITGHTQPDLLEDWFERTLGDGCALVESKVPAMPTDEESTSVLHDFGTVNWGDRYSNALLSSVIIQIHSAFEIFAKDLWFAMMEIDPPVFAAHYLGNAQKRLNISKLLPDLSHSVMGLLKNMVSWLDPAGILDAYACAIADPKVEALLGRSNASYRILCAQRNALVHAGKIVVNAKYRTATGSNDADGSVIELMPDAVVKLLGEMGQTAHELLYLVAGHVLKVDDKYRYT